METGPQVMRRYRIEVRNMSQADLAHAIRLAEGEHSKVASGYISQVERGINVPSFGRAKHIDDALEARGEIISGFGYRIVNTGSADITLEDHIGISDADITQLRADVDRLTRRLAQLGQVVKTELQFEWDELDDEIANPKPPEPADDEVDPPTGESSP